MVSNGVAQPGTVASAAEAAAAEAAAAEALCNVWMCTGGVSKFIPRCSDGNT